MNLLLKIQTYGHIMKVAFRIVAKSLLIGCRRQRNSKILHQNKFLCKLYMKFSNYNKNSHKRAENNTS